MLKINSKKMMRTMNLMINEDEKINKKAIGPIFAVLFLVSYMFMFDDEEKNKFQPPKYLKIKEN